MLKEEAMMKTAFFSRVFPGTIWTELIEKTCCQVKNKRTPLKYSELVKIQLSKEAFEIVASDLSRPNHLYEDFAPKSTADSLGIWHCISLEEKDSLNRLLIFTAGRIIPLYAAISLDGVKTDDWIYSLKQV